MKFNEIELSNLDFKGEEKNTLYVIGNGFDLYHHVKSRYKDFADWLSKEKPVFLQAMNCIFSELDPNPNTLWSNFEEALGSYDIDEIYNCYYKRPEDSLGKNKWDIAAERVVKQVSDVCKKIRPLIKRWAENEINIEAVKENTILKNLFSPKSKYLTFNYTKVLESVYHIPPIQICHIHGVVDEDEELITGHNIIGKIGGDLTSQTDEEEKAKQNIIRVMNNLAKDPKQRIVLNEAFFLGLEDITNVVVLGHSLADIDMGYFGRLLSQISQEAHWYFAYHFIKDKNAIQRFVQPAKLQKRRIQNHIIFKF